MPKDKSPASPTPSSEDGGASPTSTSAKPYLLSENPKSKRFPSSSSYSNSRLTAERREEIRQQVQQKHQERRQRREAAAAAAADNGSMLPPMMAGPSSYEHRSNGSPSSSSDGGASGSSSRGYSGLQNTPPSSSGSSFFSSASNIGIEGGQFSVDSSSYRNNTSLTINLHHGPPANNNSIYGDPFNPASGSNLSSPPTSTPYYPYPRPGIPYYHVPSPVEHMSVKPKCSNCGATHTALWRRGLNDELNCNACGLYYKLHQRPRSKIIHSSHGEGRASQAAPHPEATTVDVMGRWAVDTKAAPVYSDPVRPSVAPQCCNCHTTITPLWRKDNEGKTVCNACGLFYKLFGSARPISTKSDVIRKRSRRDGRRSGAGGAPEDVASASPGGSRRTSPVPEAFPTLAPDSDSTKQMSYELSDTTSTELLNTLSAAQTGRSFPSTRYIRDEFHPTYPYVGVKDWFPPFGPQDEINNWRSTSGGSSSFVNPVGDRSDSQNMASPPLSQPSSSSSGSSSEKMVVTQEGRSAGQAQDQSESSELQTQKSSDIYCRHLSLKQRGFPLWIPEPNCYLPIQYQRKGISIGDVGIITAAGSFDYLFNVLLAHDHPFNAGRVPLGFAPLSPRLDPSDIRGQLEFRSNSFIASSSVRRTLGNSDDQGTTFHISAPEGAILTIPDGALSEDLGNLVRLRRYMSENVESWYRHANGPRGRELSNGDLRLVIGCDKTTAWGMAAFADLSQGEDTRLRFKPVGTPQFQTYGWELHSGTAEVRSGPNAREIRALSAGDMERFGEPRPYENQCIFVRTLNATLHDTAWLELMAELSVPGGSGGSASNKDVEMSSTASENTGQRPSSRTGGRFLAHSVSTDLHAGSNSSSSDGTNDRVTVHKPKVPAYLTTHPSKSLNAAILQQYMDAKMAITDDSDWSTVLTENDIVMPKPRHLMERIFANSTFVRDARGVVYLEKNVAPSAAATLESSQAPWTTPLRLPTPPTPILPNPFTIDLDDMTRYTTRMAPMRHQSGSPSSM